MATPGCTVSFHLEDIAGANVAGKVVAALVNFGTTPPVVSGTAVLVPLTITVNAAANGTGSLVLFGNDQITPASTYWEIAVYGATSLGPVSVANYTFNSGSYDLSTAIPLSVTAGQVAAPNAVLTNPTNTQTISTYGLNVSELLALGAAVTIAGATPTASGTILGLGNTTGFGNGSAGTAVTTTTKNTGTGPTTPQTVVKYLEIDLGGTKYWIPLVQ